jgi:suppressor for copper-sensitivity B
MKTLRLLFLLFVCILSAFLKPVHRAWSEEVKVKVISSVTAIGEQSTVLLGLKFSLAQGWKLYTPQSDEASPFKRHAQLELSNSQNIKSFRIHWPAAQKITEGNETLSVYTQDVILPLWVEIDNPHHLMTLQGTLSFIACHQQCIPYEIPINFTLPSGSAQLTDDANNIEAFQLDHPLKELLEIEETPLWTMLAMAFLGGLILNFMPCVLPVLSLKLRTLVKQNHLKAQLTYKSHFAATFIGIMSSFFIYALIAISLQLGGNSLGWGMHFQEPLFRHRPVVLARVKERILSCI